MDGLLFRRAGISDVKPLADMDRICFSRPWSEQSFHEEIARNRLARYIVAELDGEMAGYAGVWVILDEGHITNVAVHPDFRRKGIAKALICSLVDLSVREGVRMFTLEVQESNKNAISLYKHTGFKVHGKRKEYYEDDHEDAIIMWKK
ncbi:MAG: ribosomal protein S18-alanine N-acetyltransferase [Clostridiales bacterium]|nr:ribosomal protein S18-alanine N-acetyltransferase [Clostridiales bacterium]